MDGIHIRRKDRAQITGRRYDIETLCLNDIHELMKDGASRNKLSHRDIRALKGAVVTHGPIETDVSNLETETIATHGDTTIARIFRLYVHTHARASYARYLNGYSAGSSGHLARKTR